MELPIATSFLSSVRRYPDCIALSIGNDTYTYLQLMDYTYTVYDLIKKQGKDQVRIGVNETFDVWMYASILAVSLAGKSYVPVGADYPKARVQKILQKTGVEWVLQSELFEKLPVISTSVDSFMEKLEASEASEAYVLFTSGSTGEPKGVAVSTQQVHAFLDHFERYAFHCEDVFLQMFRIGFDLSVFSLFIPLSVGAKIVAIADHTFVNLHLADLMRSNACTVALVVPSLIQHIQRFLPEIQPTLRMSFFCGEALKLEDAILWKSHFKQSCLINLYGPTEAAVSCTVYELPDEIASAKQHNGVVAIGVPFQETECLIVPEKLAVAGGNRGELCLSGKQVIKHYLNEESPQAFMERNGKIYYKTGDIVFQDAQGCLFFVGREDAQVKVQGYRVELQEIEHAIESFNKEVKAVVVLQASEQGDCLVAFLLHAQQNDQLLLAYLKEKLPAYMLPHQFKYLDKFPYNNNGKIDRKKLSQWK